jgi:hypothetical protein
MGTFPVSAGGATVAFTVPDFLSEPATVTLVAAPSGTTVGLPLTELAGRPVQVKADSKTIAYGEPEPAFTFTATGLSAGDDFVTEPTCGVAGTHTNVGTYDIVCSGGDAGPDYAISYVAGTLTVKKAPITVTTVSTSSLYSLITLRMGYSTTVKSAITGLPVAGVTVTTRVTGYRDGVGCTAVTNAQGVASCLSTQYATVIGQPTFTATAAESANHLGGSATGRVPRV